MVANGYDLSLIYHQSLGHINFGSSQYMRSLHMVGDLPQIELPNDVYERCAKKTSSRVLSQGQSTASFSMS